MESGKKIYIDPFKISENYGDADYIFITHDHYDHFSPEDIEKVKKEYQIIDDDEAVINPEFVATSPAT